MNRVQVVAVLVYYVINLTFTERIMILDHFTSDL